MRRAARFLSYAGGALAVLALSLYHASFIADPPYSFTGTSRFGWAIGYSALLALSTYAVGLPEQARSHRQATWLATVASTVAVLGVSVPQLLLGDALLPRFVVFGAAIVMLPWQVLMNTMSRDSRSRDEDRDRVLVVAEPQETLRLTDDLELAPERAAALVATITLDAAVGGSPGERPLVESQATSGATVIVIDRLSHTDDAIISQVATLHESGVRVRTLLSFYEDWLGKLPLSELERASLLFDISEVHGLRYSRQKRIMDIGIGLIGLVALVVITPLVAVGNLVGNRGPLMFRQTRIGKGGRPFTILKFRTMGPHGQTGDGVHGDPPHGGDAAAEGHWTLLHDPRVTPFGGLMRRTHIDELPQMINILRGDLSVVGPRPEQPRYVDELSEKLPFYDLRHLVRPGLTGWAQVKYGYAGDERDALEKLQYEFFYLRHQNLIFDQRIILRTVRSIFGGAGSGR